MFDFEKLDVYQSASNTGISIFRAIKSISSEPEITRQLKRSTLSITLNIAEGVGRVSSADRRHFYIIARGSVFETAALIKFLFELELLEKEKFEKLYAELESISKMLLALYRSVK